MSTKEKKLAHRWHRLKRPLVFMRVPGYQSSARAREIAVNSFCFHMVRMWPLSKPAPPLFSCAQTYNPRIIDELQDFAQGASRWQEACITS
jgi:hypothetical protein